MIIHLFIKDLKRIARDKKVLVIALAMPLVLTMILGLSIGKMFDSSFELEPFKVAIVDQADKQGEAAAFREWAKEHLPLEQMPDVGVDTMIGQLTSVDFLAVFEDQVLQQEEVKAFVTYKKMDEQTARKQLKEDKLAAVLIIPEQFYFKSWVNLFQASSSPVELELLKQKDQEFSATVFQELTGGYFDKLSGTIIAKDAYLTLAMKQGVISKAAPKTQAVISQLMTQTNPVMIKETNMEAKKVVSGFQYYAAAMSVMFILFTAGTVSQFFFTEKEQFTYQRMIVADVGAMRLGLANFATGAALTLGQLMILQIGTRLMFQIDWGDWVTVLIIDLVLAIGVGGLAFLLSSLNLLFNNQRAGAFFENVVVQIMAFLGGSFMPMSMMPELVVKSGNFMLNGSGLQAFLKVMQGYPVADLGSLFLRMSAFTLVMLVIGSYVYLKASGRGNEA